MQSVLLWLCVLILVDADFSSERIEVEKKRLLDFLLTDGYSSQHGEASSIIDDNLVENGEPLIEHYLDGHIYMDSIECSLHVLCYRFSVPSSIVFIRSAIFRLSNHPQQFTRIEELIFHENNRKTIVPMVLNEENDEFQANLSFLIRRWLQFRTKKNDYFTVQMECPYCFNSSLSDSRSRRFSIQSPSLTIRARHVKTNQCIGEATCCLHQFYMNFTQIGWDNWIIAPRGYMAGYCTGYCSNVASSSSSSSSDTLHARLLGDSTPPSFCAPTSFDTLNIVYAVAERQLHSKRLFALKPVACGCVS